MKNTETPSSPSYIGHVKNGVVVLGAEVSLADGQTVRVEPVALKEEPPVTGERGAELQRLQNLFAQWEEEDNKISDENAESFHSALEENRGLSFRTPKLD